MQELGKLQEADTRKERCVLLSFLYNADNVTGIVSFVKETMMLLGSFLSAHAYKTGNFHKVLIANYLV